MIFWLYKLARKFKQAIKANRDPKLIARGIALGCLLGFIPPGNLTSLVVLGLILCLKLNHAVAFLTAIAVSFAAVPLDPMTHWLGDKILSYLSDQNMLAPVWNLPLIAWTDLNNTVVLGSTLIGTLLVYPTQRLCDAILTKIHHYQAKEHEKSAQKTCNPNSVKPEVTEPNQSIIQFPPENLTAITGVSRQPNRQLIDASAYESDTNQMGHGAGVELKSPRIDIIKIEHSHHTDNQKQNNSNSGTQSLDPQLKQLLRRLRAEARKRAS